MVQADVKTLQSQVDGLAGFGVVLDGQRPNASRCTPVKVGERDQERCRLLIVHLSRRIGEVFQDGLDPCRALQPDFVIVSRSGASRYDPCGNIDVFDCSFKYYDPDREDLTLIVNPASSGLDLNTQLQLGRGVRQRFVNAGVKNVRVVFRTRDVPSEIVGKHRVVEIRFRQVVKGKKGPAMGMTNGRNRTAKSRLRRFPQISRKHSRI